ncbi:MAG TPA: DUF1990 family protein [Candidatus Thermoplasmatota archaeon]|nr:DUF1990 family protein [Candidatus Thermoplasmatota archaeon]
MRMRRVEREETVGRGAEAFARARRMLFDYAFYPPSLVSAPERPALGVTLHQQVRIGPLRFDGPALVSAFWDDPSRAGFAYEALPGHAESGWISFDLHLADEGDVRFCIVSESAPAHWLARLGAPVARAVQRRAYAAAFKRMREACGP